MKQTDIWAVAIVAGVVAVMICTLIAASSSLTYGAVAPNGISTPLTVNATDDVDDGSCDSMHCSLREAILAANGREGPDNIVFDTSVFPPQGAGVIELTAELPPIADMYTTINATNAGVTIDGSRLDGTDAHGFFIASSGITLRGIRLQSIPGIGVLIGAFEGNDVYDNTIDGVAVVDSGYGSPGLGGRADGMWILAYCQGCKACRNKIINCLIENGADDGIEVWSEGGGLADDNHVVGNVVRSNAQEAGIEIDVHGPGGSASRNRVANNIVEANLSGIIINSQGGGAVDGNIIDSNTVVKNSGWGIAILTWDPGSSASANRVINNAVEHNSSDYGIAVGSSNGAMGDGNIIDSNTVVENTGSGIVIHWNPGSSASANRVINNTVKHIGDCGIEVDAHGGVGDGNWIYHNNFIENTHCQAIDSGDNTRWDYSGEGNYWSDYTGSDEDSNGIGDTPYHIPPNGVDNYPLMTPYTYEQRIYLPVLLKYHSLTDDEVKN